MTIEQPMNIVLVIVLPLYCLSLAGQERCIEIE